MTITSSVPDTSGYIVRTPTSKHRTLTVNVDNANVKFSGSFQKVTGRLVLKQSYRKI